MKPKTWRSIYSIIFYLCLPLVMCRMLWRSLKAPAYAKRWRERFGHVGKLNVPKGAIWIHAVSVGEFNAACPLIKQVQEQYPGMPLLVTTTTPTGSTRVKTVFGDSIAHTYAPYDLPHTVARFLSYIQPKCLVIMETELWPNLLAQCDARGIPVMIANARLSERSAIGYRRILPIMQGMLKNITLIAAQTEKDAHRFLQLGGGSKQVTVTGNLKFDQEIPQSISEIATRLRGRWDVTRPVWIAASTHEGEEELVLQAHAKVLAQIPNALLLLVPRHPERFAKVIAMVRKLGYVTSTRSADDASERTQVFIGDTMGELTTFYASGDVAYVGGSLVPIGGHNLLEPAAIGVPSITGPHYFNMKTVTTMLIERGVTKEVLSVDELADVVVTLLQNSLLRSEMGEKGRRIVMQNRGAVRAHMEVLQNMFPA